MVSAGNNLTRVLVVTLDPASEVADRYMSSPHSDEYAAMLLDLEPSDDELDRLSALEKEQDALQDGFIHQWLQVAEKLADKKKLTLYIDLYGTEETDEAAAFRQEVSRQVVLDSDGKTWKAAA